jgi:hypothetical protein
LGTARWTWLIGPCGNGEHPSRIGRLERGEIDAIFDEGLVLWANLLAGVGAHLLPLSPDHLEVLEAEGFRRGLIEKSGYPTLPRAIPTVDFSGWPSYCRTNTDDGLVEQFCQAPRRGASPEGVHRVESPPRRRAPSCRSAAG